MKAVTSHNGRSKGRSVLSNMERVFAEHYVQTSSALRSATAAGYKNPEVLGSRLLKRQRVKEYIELLFTGLNNDAARDISNAVGRGIVRRDELICRLWQLACLSHKETKGSITGQIAAAKELAEILGMKVKYTVDISAEMKDRSEEEQEFFCVHGYWPERS